MSSEIVFECPNPFCRSNRINQYRMMTGPMWCMDCGYRIEKKENKNRNPFIKKIKP
ncbi:MAG: hypothetical protein GY870_08265 [archaeon]|nr:hypothetical protein [archaeon]